MLTNLWNLFFRPISEYIRFFAKFNVLGLAIGLMIGSNLKDVAGVFIDDVVMPFVNPFINIVTKGEGMYFTIPKTSIKINLERVFSSGIKFVCLTALIFIMLQMGVRLKKPIQWVSVRNWRDADVATRRRRRKNVSQM